MDAFAKCSQTDCPIIIRTAGSSRQPKKISTGGLHTGDPFVLRTVLLSLAQHLSRLVLPELLPYPNMTGITAPMLDGSLDDDFQQELKEVEEAYRSFLESGDDCSQLHERIRRVFSDAATYLAAGELSSGTREAVFQLASSVRVISGALCQLQQRCSAITTNFQMSARAVLQGPDPVGSEQDDGSHSELSSIPLRHWFLAHFDYPYPDENAYTFLGGQLPCMTRHQIGTWFINARRRSGWTDFRRETAEEDYHNFQRLLATIDEPGNEAAKKKYDKVRLYFEPARKDVVSETILEVIKQKTAKDLPSTKHVPATRAVQRATKRAARGVGARHEEEDELAPAVQGSWSPRRRHELPAASSPLPAPSFDPIVDFHRNTTPSPGSGSDLGLPRLPSAFVPPATSARSFSGSSSSSLESLVSYGSSDYDPRNARIEYTMPSAGAPAISVAPPQQQQGTSSSSQTLALPALDYPHVLRAGPPNFSSPTRPHPYFCTLNELPPVPNLRGGFANPIPR